MKIKVFISVLVFINIKILSQTPLPVYDPIVHGEVVASSAIATDVLAECRMQTEVVGETLDFWHKAEETLTKVNKNVRDVLYIKMITKREIDMMESIINYKQKINQMKYISDGEVELIYRIFNEVTDQVRSLIKTTTIIMQSELFRMSDSDRIEQLIEINKELAYRQYVINIAFDTYFLINRDRETMDLLKKISGS